MSVVLLVVGLILFVGLVVVHEFGHFLVARRGGVEVEEFGIGFPPRAWSRKTKKGFLFSLNWLPIGGFVKLKGESDAATEKGTLGAASTWTKAKIMLAGVGMNLLVAFGIFTLLALVGMPQFIDNQFTIKSDTKIARNEVLAGYIESNSPASKAGLKTRDQLLSVGVPGDTKPVTSASALPTITESFAGQKVTVHYIRSGQESTAQLTMRSKAEVNASKNSAQPKGYLGISPAEFTLTRATWSAPVQAAGLIWQFTVATLKGLGGAIVAVFHGHGGQAASQVSGPVGIVVLLRDGSLLGYQFVLMIIGILSLTLALMNVLPIPALDGGRLFMMLLSRASERLGGKRMSQRMEEAVVGASFIFLLFLIGIITVVDVKRFF